MAVKHRLVFKNKKKTVGRLLILILPVLLLVGIIVGAVKLFNSCSLAASKRSLPFAASVENAYTGDGFIYMDGSELKYMSLKDEGKNYSISVSTPTAKLMGTGSIKVVYNTRALQIIGTQYDIDGSGQIEKLCCGGGFVAVCRKDDSGKRTLRAYDTTGSQCCQLDFTDTVLTDFGFESGSSSVLWTSELITTGNSITTTITIYDLGRSSTTGVISVQGQLVKDVYITGDSIFAVCTENIIRFDRRSNSEAYRLLSYGYDCVSCSFKDGRALFVLREEDGGKNSVRLLSVSEKSVANEKSSLIILPEGTLNYFAMDGRFIVAASEGLLIYNVNGERTKDVAFDHAVTSAEKLDERNILIKRGEEAMLYTLK